MLNFEQNQTRCRMKAEQNFAFGLFADQVYAYHKVFTDTMMRVVVNLGDTIGQRDVGEIFSPDIAHAIDDLRYSVTLWQNNYSNVNFLFLSLEYCQVILKGLMASQFNCEQFRRYGELVRIMVVIRSVLDYNTIAVELFKEKPVFVCQYLYAQQVALKIGAKILELCTGRTLTYNFVFRGNVGIIKVAPFTRFIKHDTFMLDFGDVANINVNQMLANSIAGSGQVLIIPKRPINI